MSDAELAMRLMELKAAVPRLNIQELVRRRPQILRSQVSRRTFCSSKPSLADNSWASLEGNGPMMTADRRRCLQHGVRAVARAVRDLEALMPALPVQDRILGKDGQMWQSFRERLQYWETESISSS